MITLIIIAFLCAAAYYFGARNRTYWKKRNVPSSPPKWLVGDYKNILTGTRHMGLVFQDMYKAHPDALYAEYLKMRQPCVLLRDPELIKTVLAKDFSSFANNDITIDKDVNFLFGYNPFVLKGEEWKRSRNHFIPTITGTKLKTYYPSLLPVCDSMVRYIGGKIGENGIAELETKRLSGDFTTDVVANAVFGISVDTFANENNQFAKVARSLIDNTLLNHVQLLLILLFPQLIHILKIRFISKECEDFIISITKKVIKHRIDTGEKRNDFFQQMITYRENDHLGVFTDNYIASHCTGFMSDGYETSSDVICFTLFELAWHDDIQEKVREEISKMLVESGGDMTYEGINSLKYLDMVVSESLRMHPPVLMFTRVCTAKSYCLPAASAAGGANASAAAGVEIDPGTPVCVPVYALHMDPLHYPDPLKFDPERFTPKVVAARHKYVYLPFGEGPRICLGMKFGQMQVKAGLVAVLSKFRMRPSPRSSYPVEIDHRSWINRPLNGAWVYFQKL